MSSLATPLQVVEQNRADTQFNQQIVPLCGALGTVVGLAIAGVLVPDRVSDTVSVQLAAVAMTAGLLSGPAVAVYRNTRAILRVENMLMIGIVYWVMSDALQLRYELADTTPAGIFGAFAATGLFAVGAWGAVLIGSPGLPGILRRSASLEFSERTLFMIATFCFAAGMFNFAYTSGFDPLEMIGGLFKNRVASPWQIARLQPGRSSWESFIEQTVNFGYLLPCLAMLLGTRYGWSRAATLVAIVFSVIFLPFIAQTGNRRMIGLIIGSSLIVYLMTARRIRSRNLAIAAVLVLILLIAMEILLDARGGDTGLAKFADSDAMFNRERVIRVDDNFLRLSQITTIFPDRSPFLYHQRILFTVTRPIPRAFWPGKPTDPGFDLANFLGYEGLSLSASAVADFFMSAGYLGAFLGGGLFGLFAVSWDDLLKRKPTSTCIILYSFGAMTVFVGLRSIDEIAFQSYGLIVWLFLIYAVGGRGR